MDRRRYLHLGAGLVSSAALAGCSADGTSEKSPSTTRASETTTPERTGTDGERGVYVQSFREGMYVVGMGGMGGSNGSEDTVGAVPKTREATPATSGPPDTNATTAMPVADDYRFALLYAAPHVFWTVTGADTERVAIEEGDSLHLMSVVWDPNTGTVLPDVGLSVELSRGGTLVSEEVIYPMLSQRMGFHYGANFALSADGTYTAKLSVGGTSVRRTGAFAGRFSEPASVEIEFPFTETTREQVVSPEATRAGEPGAVAPMNVSTIPAALAPTRAQLPGTVLGRAESDGAVFVVSRLPPAESPIDSQTPYLAVSARTPYNRLVLPAMALSATVERGEKRVFEGALERTLDPDLGYHYGVSVAGATSGATVTISVTTPPQVARHEGYETAFLDMPDVTFRL